MRDKPINKKININAIWGIVGCTIALIILIRPLIMEENAYSKIEGEIELSFQTSIAYYIRLNTSEKRFAILGDNNDIFEEKAPVGENATIWYRKSFRHRGVGYSGFTIEKLIVNDEVIIPYYRGMWINIFFMCIVGLFLVSSIIEITKKTGKKFNTLLYCIHYL